jgi:hypothetical protein
MTEEYWKPSEIRFSVPQILWLLKYVSDSLEWPVDHRYETGYVGGPGKKQNHIAPYATVKEIVGELNARLVKCGEDGLMLEYCARIGALDEWSYQKLGRYFRLPWYEVKKRVFKALNYCRGRKRKKQSYREYRPYRKERG